MSDEKVTVCKTCGLLFVVHTGNMIEECMKKNAENLRKGMVEDLKDRGMI